MREALPPDVPVLAFAGAPFTVASYLVEGAPSRDYRHTKALMHTDEALWHEVHGRLATLAVAFVGVQLDAGAGAFQLFDSWAGALSRGRLRAVRPAPLAARVRRARRSPPGCAGRSTSASAATTCSSRCAPPARSVIGPRLAHADRRGAAPASAPTSSCRATSTRRSCSPAATSRSPAPDAVLADNGGHPGHIFNLGHGVHPNTDPDVLAAVVDAVHERTPTAVSDRSCVL